jgi:hypothetical protein
MWSLLRSGHRATIANRSFVTQSEQTASRELWCQPIALVVHSYDVEILRPLFG